MAQNKVVALVTVGGLILVGCLAIQKPSIQVRRRPMTDFELMKSSMKTYNGLQQTAARRR